MLDIRILRESPEIVIADLEKRGRDTEIVANVRALDESWREALGQQNGLRQTRNAAAKGISAAKKSGGDVQAAIAEMGEVNKQLAELEARVGELADERDTLLRSLPNIMHPDVPVGKDEEENVEIRSWGGKPQHDFAAKSHVDLLTDLDIADLETAAAVAGARFYYLKNDLVMLGRALEFFALQQLSAKGYIPIEPPYMLRREAIEGAIDLSDFEDVIYKIEDEDLYLIATSEHPLASLHTDAILDQLPLRYAGVSPCFRKEAGAHGKDTKGIFRVHQFSKVEQFIYCKPDDSWALHDELIANAEALYQALQIPYRVVDICTGDLGTVAARKYDIEAWMPVQQAYREVVSCSNCTDYQARRYKTRYRPAAEGPTEPVHTLNSTAIAVQRTLVAILENLQRADGSVAIPLVLQPLVGKTHIEAIEQKS